VLLWPRGFAWAKRLAARRSGDVASDTAAN